MFALRSFRATRPSLSRSLPRVSSRSLTTWQQPIRSSLSSRSWLMTSALVAGVSCYMMNAHTVYSAPESEKPKNDMTDEEIEALIEKEIQKIKDEEKQKEQEEPERSEPRYAYPGRPGVTVICGATIDGLVYNPHLDVFLEVYAPGCHWCEKMEVAVDQLAKTIAHVNRQLSAQHTSEENSQQTFDGQRILVGVMNGDANYKYGLLTEKERNASPVIKFYPAISEGTSRLPPSSPPLVLTYNSRGTALAMLRYIHEHGQHQFDLADAEQVLHTFDKETDERLTTVFRKQLEEEAAREQSIRALSLSPCGPLFHSFMEFMDVAKYSSTHTDEQRDEQLHEKMSAYHKCTQSAKSKEFWTGLYEMSKTMLDVEDKDKKETTSTPKE